MVADCTQCNRPEMDDFVDSMFVNGGYLAVCPLCALKIMNEIRGLGTEPFRGEIARQRFEDAYAVAKSLGTNTDFERQVAERMGVA